MKNFFNPMNSFFRFMNLVVDLIGVNLLFLLCSVPIFTIGPALSALYTITMKLVRGNSDSPVKSFWHAFKQNMKQGILLELLSFAVGVLLVINTWLSLQLRIVQQNSVYSVLFILCIVFIALYAAMLVYLFPLQAQFTNSIKGTIQNAFLMSIRHLPKTFCIAALPIIVCWLTMLNSVIFTILSVVLFLIGFVLIAYLQSHLLVSIFDIYINSHTEETAVCE